MRRCFSLECVSFPKKQVHFSASAWLNQKSRSQGSKFDNKDVFTEWSKPAFLNLFESEDL